MAVRELAWNVEVPTHNKTIQNIVFRQEMTRFELEMMVLGSDIYSNVYWTNNENNKIEAQDQANVPSRKMINL